MCVARIALERRDTAANTGGARIFDLTQGDYRKVEGIRVPFAIDYLSADATLPG